MKTPPVKSCAATFLLAFLWAAGARAWDQTISYQNIFAANAMKHVVEQTNIERDTFGEITFWRPVANDKEARLTQKFVFSRPVVKACLRVDYIFVTNYGARGSGKGSLWGSKDGKVWVQLGDSPTPTEVAAGLNYASTLPESLMGGTELWVQARLFTQGSHREAQFLRYDAGARNNNCFDLSVNLEPGGAPGPVIAKGQEVAGNELPVAVRLAEIDLSIALKQYEKVRQMLAEFELEQELQFLQPPAPAEDREVLAKRIVSLRESSEKLRREAMDRGDALEKLKAAPERKEAGGP